MCRRRILAHVCHGMVGMPMQDKKLGHEKPSFGVTGRHTRGSVSNVVNGEVGTVHVIAKLCLCMLWRCMDNEQALHYKLM